MMGSRVASSVRRVRHTLVLALARQQHAERLETRRAQMHTANRHTAKGTRRPRHIIKMQRIGCMSLLVVLLSVFGPLAGCVWLDSATHACRQAPCTSLAVTTTTTALPWPGNRVHRPATRPGEAAVQCSAVRMPVACDMTGHVSVAKHVSRCCVNLKDCVFDSACRSFRGPGLRGHPAC